MNDDKKVDFLKAVHQHLESRIQFVDQKASILIGVVAIIIGGVFAETIIGLFFRDSFIQFLSFEFFYTLWASVNVMSALFILMYLMNTIKPSTRRDLPKFRIDNYIMWFSNKDTSEMGLEQYIQTVNSLKDRDV